MAHEYAHVIDAHERRDRAVTSGTVVFLTLVVIVMLMLSRPGAIAASGGAPGVTGALAGWGCCVLATALMASVARRAEYRADAHAAQLLGSPHPVIAMLLEGDPNAKARAGALVHGWTRALTHPSAQRRIARLEGRHADDETLRIPTSA